MEFWSRIYDLMRGEEEPAAGGGGGGWGGKG